MGSLLLGGRRTSLAPLSAQCQSNYRHEMMLLCGVPDQCQRKRKRATGRGRMSTLHCLVSRPRTEATDRAACTVKGAREARVTAARSASSMTGEASISQKGRERENKATVTPVPHSLPNLGVAGIGVNRIGQVGMLHIGKYGPCLCYSEQCGSHYGPCLCSPNTVRVALRALPLSGKYREFACHCHSLHAIVPLCG